MYVFGKIKYSMPIICYSTAELFLDDALRVGALLYAGLRAEWSSVTSSFIPTYMKKTKRPKQMDN